MSKPINLVSVGHSYVVSLNRSILREIAEDPGFNVTIISPKVFKGSLRTIASEPEPSGSKLKLKTVDAYLTQKMHVFSYNSKELKRGLSEEPYDLLHIWEEPYIYSGYQTAKIAHRLGLPFCVRTAQSLVKKYIYPFRYFEKKVFGWCHRWIAGGHLVHEAMRTKGWGDQKGIVLSLGVNTESFTPFDEGQKQQAQEKLGLRGPVVGYLGRLSEEKGLDVIMEAMTSLKDQPWSLLLMGSGPYEKKIKQWAKELGVSDRVKIQLYSHNEIPKILPACDMLLCPSQTRPFWKEQFGRMVVEAFASGVPVIASDSGEIPRVVGSAGVILPEQDIEKWSCAVDRLLREPGERDRLRLLGLERAQKYSVKSIAEDYKKFYRSILQGS